MQAISNPDDEQEVFLFSLCSQGILAQWNIKDSDDGNESQFTLDTFAQLPEFKKG